MRSLAGTRIRQRRKALNLRQIDLARAAGISPSYLNLIEHNRRNVTEAILATLAGELGLASEALAEGAESALQSDLRETAALYAAQKPEVDGIDEFIGRYPGWARLTAMLSRQTRDHSAAMAALTERINYDPQLQETLHEMLTNITAIRSTAGILVSEPDIPAETVARFQDVIQDESRRLSTAAQHLVTYFDRAADTPGPAATPQEAFELFLDRHDHVFPALEAPDDPAATIARMIADEPLLAAPDAEFRAQQRLETFAADAAAMPLDDFAQAARDCAYAPDRLAAIFGQSLHPVFRRLAVLRRHGINAPRFGLVILNAAGQPLFRRPLADFSLPRFNSICALWPVFDALSSQGQAIEEIIVLPNGREFLARAIAEPITEISFGARQSRASAMLVTDLRQAFEFGMIGSSNPSPQRPVGTSCRLCTRADCAARSEPNVLMPETPG